MELWLFILASCSSTCFFILFYSLCELLTNTLMKGYPQSSVYEVSNKSLSAVHAVLISFASVFAIAATKHDFVYAEHPLAVICSYISVGYSFYDLYAMYFVFNEKKLYASPSYSNVSFLIKLKNFCCARSVIIVHHLLFVIAVPIYEPMRLNANMIRRGDFAIACMNFMELSTPFVCIRAILSELSMKKSTLYTINGILMIIAFFICRVMLWPFLFYSYSEYANIPILHVFVTIPKKCLVGSSIVWSLQIYWFYLMICGAFSFLKKPESHDKED